MMNMMVDRFIKEAILGGESGVQVEQEGKVAGRIFKRKRKGHWDSLLNAHFRGCASGDW